MRAADDTTFTTAERRACYAGAVPEPLLLIDVFARGMGVGAVVVMGLSTLGSRLPAMTRAVIAATAVSMAAWLVTESHVLWPALGQSLLALVPAYPVGGLFWLLVLTVFDDRQLRPSLLAPAALLIVSGFAMTFSEGQFRDALWGLRNAAGGLLAVHAGLVLGRGWRGDLIEGRRQLRGPILALAVAFTILEVGLALVNYVHPLGPLLELEAGAPLGGVIVAAIMVAAAATFLQARTTLIGAARRPDLRPDGRSEAADRIVIEKLAGVMAAEAWRREGLTIGDLATELDVPEHRLRRLINQRLGYRNFADFLNGHRIEAAKRRLGDPAEARTSIAAVAFDLGFGSLGPFNRAFRAATGATPTAWRRQALAAASPEMKEAV
jgi:AraC-like DNA-binding protein